MAITATYSIPATGRLMVRIDGIPEDREATEADIEMMGFVPKGSVHSRFRSFLWDALAEEDVLRGDLTDNQLNPLRYLSELAEHLPDHLLQDRPVPADVEQLAMDIRAIERALQLLADGQGLEASQLYRDHLVAREIEKAHA